MHAMQAGRSARAAKEAAAKAKAMEVDGAGPAAAAGGQGSGAGAGVDTDPAQAPAAIAAAPVGSGRCFYTPLTRLVKTAGAWEAGSGRGTDRSEVCERQDILALCRRRS